MIAVQRNWITLPALMAGAVVCGVAVAVQPLLTVGLFALCAILALAFAAPVAHLVLLLLVLAIVPFELQNSFGIGGGTDSPGLIASDALLMAGLLRATLLLPRQPADARRLAVGGALLVFLFVASVQFVHGLTVGRPPGDVGAEYRILLGFSTFFIALPILADPVQRRKLTNALLPLGILLGLWGIVQWIGGFSFTGVGDFGVREGVSFTSAGEGQVQGGLFGFPVALVLGFAMLLSTASRSVGARVALVALVALNAVSLLLTFERTLWVASVLGIGFVTLRAGRAQRVKGLIWIAIAAAIALAAFATVAPGQLTTARERLLSLGQYQTDGSLRYRIVESSHVIDKIRERPIAGSGLADTIRWARPWEGVPMRTYRYTHNSYLSFMWRLGIPAALLFFALLAWAIVARGADARSPSGALRNGAQGALLTLAVISVTFATFNALTTTAVFGFLFAVVATSSRGRAARPDGGPRAIPRWEPLRARP